VTRRRDGCKTNRWKKRSRRESESEAYAATTTCKDSFLGLRILFAHVEARPDDLPKAGKAYLAQIKSQLLPGTILRRTSMQIASKDLYT
jgi:hypothetical protein